MDLGPATALLLMFLTTVVLLLVVLASIARFSGVRLDQRRSVLVHTSHDRVWEFVRRLPELHGRHGKTTDYADLSEWSLRQGSGESAGSVWRAQGTWGPAPYWVEMEILRSVPGQEVAIRLRRDSFGTHRGLHDHHGLLRLEAIGPDVTKITWHLRATLRGPRLVLARLFSGPTLRARLLDQGLRSLKTEIDFVARRDQERPVATSGDRHGTVSYPPSPAGARPPEKSL